MSDAKEMKSLIRGLITVAISFLASAMGSYAQHCDPRSLAALEATKEALGFDQDNVTNFWIYWNTGQEGHRYYRPEALEVMRMHQAKIAKFRKWVETLKGPDRTAYLWWVEWYEDGTKEAIGEYHSHKDLDHMNAFDIQQARCRKEMQNVKIAQPPMGGNYANP